MVGEQILIVNSQEGLPRLPAYAGAEGLGAVKGDQRVPLAALHGSQAALFQRVFEEVQADGIEVSGRHAVEGKQGVGVGAFAALFEFPRCGEEGGALCEEDGKGGHTGIGHGMAGVVAGALVGHGGATAFQKPDMILEGLHPHVESGASGNWNPFWHFYCLHCETISGSAHNENCWPDEQNEREAELRVLAEVHHCTGTNHESCVP